MIHDCRSYVLTPRPGFVCAQCVPVFEVENLDAPRLDQFDDDEAAMDEEDGEEEDDAQVLLLDAYLMSALRIGG